MEVGDFPNFHHLFVIPIECFSIYLYTRCRLRRLRRPTVALTGQFNQWAIVNSLSL